MGTCGMTGTAGMLCASSGEQGVYAVMGMVIAETAAAGIAAALTASCKPSMGSSFTEAKRDDPNVESAGDKGAMEERSDVEAGEDSVAPEASSRDICLDKRGAKDCERRTIS